MANTSPLLKCTQSYCTFETRNATLLAARHANSSTNGTRWICQGGKKCGAVFCSTQAMDGPGGHNRNRNCRPFYVWNLSRKYGWKMVDRLEFMSRRSIAQLDGTEPNRPPPGFSTRHYNETVANKKESEDEEEEFLKPKKRSKPEPTPSPAPTLEIKSGGKLQSSRKLQTESEHWEYVYEDERASEHGDGRFESEKSATSARGTRAAVKQRSDLKRKHVDQDNDSDEDFEPEMHATRSRKSSTINKRRSNLKRKAVDRGDDGDDAFESEMHAIGSRKPSPTSKQRHTTKRRKGNEKDERKSDDEEDGSENEAKKTSTRVLKRTVAAKKSTTSKPHKASLRSTPKDSEQDEGEDDAQKDREQGALKHNFRAVNDNPESEASQEVVGASYQPEGTENKKLKQPFNAISSSEEYASEESGIEKNDVSSSVQDEVDDDVWDQQCASLICSRGGRSSGMA